MCGDLRDVFLTTSGCLVFFLTQTTLLASKQRKRAAGNRDWEGSGRRPGQWWGFLGPVVLFAVGFIAQNTIDLVDNGRRQFGKDLCVTRTHESPSKTGPGRSCPQRIQLQLEAEGGLPWLIRCPSNSRVFQNLPGGMRCRLQAPKPDFYTPKELFPAFPTSPSRVTRTQGPSVTH